MVGTNPPPSSCWIGLEPNHAFFLSIYHRAQSVVRVRATRAAARVCMCETRRFRVRRRACPGHVIVFPNFRKRGD